MLFADDFDERPFLPAAIELAVKNLFPRTEVQFSGSDRHYHLAPHNLAFHVGVGIILARAIVTVLRDWGMRRELFEPHHNPDAVHFRRR